MDPASDQEPERLKRARISDPMVTFATKPPKGLRPLEAAKRTAQSVIKTLPPDIIPLAETHSSEFLKLRTELAKLQLNKLKLANDEYTPKSTRFKFSLGASDRVMENAPKAFDSLVQKNEHVLWAFNNDLKTHISASIDLEIKVLREEISNQFCFALNAIAISFGITKGLTPSLSQTLALYTILSKEDENKKIFQWTEFTREEFIPTYQAAIHDRSPAEEFASYSKDTVATFEEYVPHLHYVISGIYAKSWDSYIAAEVELKKKAKLKLYLDLLTKETTTSETAMDLEDINLTQTALQDIVADKVAKALRPMVALQRDFDSLKKQFAAEKAKNSTLTSSQSRNSKPTPKATKSSPSNDNRGAKNASAPSQKKKGQKQSRNNAQKADDHDNASTDGKKTTKKKNNNANKKNSNKSSKKGKKD
jgi:hypothetical protein